jgi:uncharacterized membrane protein
VIAVSTGLYAGAWGYALFLSPHGGDNTWAPPLLLQGFMVYLGILLICIGAIIVSRQDRRSAGHQPPPPGTSGPASRRLPPAGPGKQFPGGALATGPVPASG